MRHVYATCNRTGSRLAAAAQVEMADHLRGVLPLLCARAAGAPWNDASASADTISALTASSASFDPAAAVGLWIMSLAVDACVEPAVLLPALQVSFGLSMTVLLVTLNLRRGV